MLLRQIANKASSSLNTSFSFFLRKNFSHSNHRHFNVDSTVKQTKNYLKDGFSTFADPNYYMNLEIKIFCFLFSLSLLFGKKNNQKLRSSHKIKN